MTCQEEREIILFMDKPVVLTITWLDRSLLIVDLRPGDVGPVIRVMKALKERGLIKHYTIAN